MNGVQRPKTQRRATVFFDSKKYAEESKAFKVKDMDFEKGAEDEASE